MMNIHEILDNPNSFGLFNAILILRENSLAYQAIFDAINKAFNPHKIFNSKLNLDSFEFESIDDVSTVFCDARENSILKTIFITECEKIILEYHKGEFIIEHLFHFEKLKETKGNFIISDYFNISPSAMLVLGFELSIHINELDTLVSQTLKDVSTYPISTINKTKGDIGYHEYSLKKEGIAIRKINAIEEYKKMLNIN